MFLYGCDNVQINFWLITLIVVHWCFVVTIFFVLLAFDLLCQSNQFNSISCTVLLNPHYHWLRGIVNMQLLKFDQNLKFKTFKTFLPSFSFQWKKTLVLLCANCFSKSVNGICTTNWNMKWWIYLIPNDDRE